MGRNRKTPRSIRYDQYDFSDADERPMSEEDYINVFPDNLDPEKPWLGFDMEEDEFRRVFGGPPRTKTQEEYEAEPFRINDERNSTITSDIAFNAQKVQGSSNAAIQSYLDKQAALSPSERESQPLYAIAIYGTVDQRMRAIQIIMDAAEQSDSNKWKQAINKLESSSLDYVLVKNPDEEDFMNKFWDIWVKGPWSDTGQLQDYMSTVGPNADEPAPHYFYPDYAKPIQLNPIIVQHLQQQYNRTQERLKQLGYPEDGELLWRGTGQVRGLGLESWSPAEGIGMEFKYRAFQNGELRAKQIPRKYIFGGERFVSNWPAADEYVFGEQEVVVLGTALYAQTGTNDTPNKE